MLIYLSTCCLTSLAGIRAWGRPADGSSRSIVLVDGGRPIADSPPWGFGYFAIHTESCMVAKLRVLLPKGSGGSGGKGSRLGQEGRRSLPFLVDSNPLQAWATRPKRTLRTFSVPIPKQPLPAFKKPS